MKIAFILSEAYITPLNGIVSQALSWKTGLEAKGHQVDLISPWDKTDWAAYDVIHYYGFSSYMAQHIARLKGVNHRIAVSPILDPYYPVFLLKCYARLGCGTRLTNYFHSLYRCRKDIQQILVRSEFELKYMTEGFSFSREQCVWVPLSCDAVDPIADPETDQNGPMPKENFCFHCSLLADKRKNVQRLVEAAKKYRFRLILGGHLRNKAEEDQLRAWIGGAANIEYRGFLSKQEMHDLYRRAKVFALPSLNEGVGIVAMEAASAGCDIVLTDRGGPKEYYAGMARTVDPSRVDDIGSAVIDMLNGETHQPALRQHIIEKYSREAVTEQLIAAYQRMK